MVRTLYSYAENTDMAASEARHTLSLLSGHNPTLPVFLDIEHTRDGCLLYTSEFFGFVKQHLHPKADTQQQGTLGRLLLDGLDQPQLFQPLHAVLELSLIHISAPAIPAKNSRQSAGKILSR